MPESETIENAAPDDRKQLYLIDAMALAYRAHYSFISRPLINSKGKNTSAAYGFTNMLLKLIEDHEMEHIAVVFDVPSEEGTFRKDLYEDYKAHRDPPPDELLENLPYMKKIVRAMDIPVLAEPGVEADDVIGTLARRAEEDGAESVIVSADKDFKQLLTENVSIFKPARGDTDFETITAESFEEEEGFAPPHFADQLALWGDTSDNVPGVPLIGEKTSAKLLREYGDVEGVLAHADDVGGKRGESLTENADQARLSKKLVTIKTDVPVPFDWHELYQDEPDIDELAGIFDELEFSNFLDRITGDSDVATQRAASKTDGEDSALSFDFGPYEAVKKYDADAVDYETIMDLDGVEALAEKLRDQERYAFDTETTSTNAMVAELVGIAFSWQEAQGRYVPTPLPDGTSTEDVLAALAPALEAESEKVGHNLKYDLTVLEQHGAAVGGPLFDTMVAHYLTAPQGQHSLDAVARKHLSYRARPIEDLIGEGKDQISMREVDLEKAGPYACEDADLALRLVKPLSEKLREDGLYALAENMEFPLVRVLTAMERRGICIDEARLKSISEELGEELAEIEARIFELAGEEFNVNSTQQLGEVLFEKLDLPVVSKTSTGRPSTKESVLQRLSSEHEIPGLVLEYRSIAKLKGTYLDSLGGLVNEETGRIHTSFNQTVTATGRLSCLPAGTKVNTERGLVGIETVRPGERIRTPYGSRRVVGWQQTGDKPLVTLQLANGITLRCSPDHRLRTCGMWKRADELEKGAPVYMSFRDGLFGDRTELAFERTAAYRTRKSPHFPEAWSVELAELTGYLMADGHICHSNHNGKPSKVVLAFGWEEGALMDRMAAYLRRLFGKEATRRTTRTCPVLEVSSVDVAGAFEQLGAGGLSGDLRVPKSLYEAPEAVVAGFLRGYLEGDGHVKLGEGVSVRSVSRALLADVQQLLTLFGIPTTLRADRPDPRGYATRHTLCVVGDRSKETFAERISFLSERKQSACEAVAACSSKRSPAECLSLPEEFEVASFQPALYEAHRQPNGRVPNALHQFTSKMRQRRTAITLSRAEQATRALRADGSCSATGFVEEAAGALYYQTEIAEITIASSVPMYDISVAEVDQYMAQGVVVHNSSDPNLQNVPVRTERGREIRKAFVPQEGWLLMAADYAQIELRILASMSGDEAMRETFRTGGDIHTDAAARVFDIDPEEVTRDQRRKAKEVNYGIPYGVSPWGLSRRLGSTREEAEELIDQYRRSYPGVSRLLAELVERAKDKGYAETLRGRRRYVPELRASNSNRRSFAERVAVNMPIQGTQADMIKIAMVRIHERLAAEGLASRMLLQVHDELVFEQAPDEEDALRTLVEEEMQHALPLEVPIAVDIDTGANWLDAH